jgi:two-component system nitrate/nitrite response regulator NarL
VDDHRLFADALRASLEHNGIIVPAIATSGAEALEIAQNEQPDVCLVDVGLPDQSGLVVASAIKRAAPSARIIVLTGINDPRLAEQSSRLGFGYMTKQTPVRRVLDAVRAAVDGRSSMITRSSTRRTGRSDEALLADQLTRREREVLMLLVEGLSGAAIARRLRISSNTVRTHIQSILTKLQVHSRLAAATFAVRHGLVSTGRGRESG